MTKGLNGEDVATTAGLNKKIHKSPKKSYS